VLLHEVVHNVEPEENDLPNPPVAAVTPPTTGEVESPEGSGEESPATTEETPKTDETPDSDEPPATDDAPAEDAAPVENTTDDEPASDAEPKE
jgi:hypothetical protein